MPQLEELFDGFGFEVSPLYTMPESMFDALPSDTLPLDTLSSDTLPSDALPSDALPSDALPLDTLPSNTLQFSNLLLNNVPFDPSFGDLRFDAWLFDALQSTSHPTTLVAMPSATYMSDIQRVQWEDAKWTHKIEGIMGIPFTNELACDCVKCMGFPNPAHSRAYEFCGGKYVCYGTAHGLEPCRHHHAEYPVGDPYRGALASGHPLDHELAGLARRGNPFDGCAFCTCLALDTKIIMDARDHSLGLMRAQKQSARLEWHATSRPDQPIAFKCID
jgi:hypothetical protein